MVIEIKDIMDYLQQNYENDPFVLDNINIIAECFEINYKNNGVHFIKLFKHNNRFITWFEYAHLKNLSIKYNLNLKLEEINHMGYCGYLNNSEMIATCFTNQPATKFPGLGRINNIQLKNNFFNYGNPLFICDIYTFFSMIWIENNINNFPVSLTINNNLYNITDWSINGFQHISTNSSNILEISQNSGLISSRLITNNDIYEINQYNNILNQNIQQERLRMVRTIANYENSIDYRRIAHPHL